MFLVEKDLVEIYVENFDLDLVLLIFFFYLFFCWGEGRKDD